MATPMTADEFLAALRAEGVRAVEHPGWRTHNREGHGAWGPAVGVMIHHTAGAAPSDGEIVWSGRPDLPGPCAHGYLAKGGVVTMTANGRANHAGGGDPVVLTAVMDEAYITAPPAPHEHEGSAGAVDGNARFYGLEISNRGDGKDPYPPEQYDAAVRWAAAICRHHDWTAKSVIGHKEWSDWKPDPSFDIATFRDAVAARLAHPADWNPSDPITEDDMALTDADVQKILSATMDDPTKGGTATVTVRGALWAAYGQATAANAAAQKSAAQTGGLIGLVTQLLAAVQKGGGLTVEQATAAAEAGAKAALEQLAAALQGGGS